MTYHNGIIINKILFIFFIIQRTILSAGKSSELFEADVDWTCASDAIQVVVRTSRPFHGIIRPSGFPVKKPPPPAPSPASALCAMRGTGTLTTQLQIPLEPGQSAWDECGVQMDPDSSTLWVLLEVHEHPLVMLNQDRTVNISCTGWSHSPNDSRFSSADQLSDFRLAIVSPNGTVSSSAASPVEIAFLGTEYNLSVLAVQPTAWANVFVHSCSATSADQLTKVQLIDADGCSMDQHLITDFEQSNRLSFNGLSSSTHSPLIIRSKQKTTAPNQKLPVATVATAKIPQMFRFNTQFDQRRLNIGSVIHFECTVERCEERTPGKTPTEIAPCPRTNCDRKRTIAEKTEAGANKRPFAADAAVAEHGAGVAEVEEELELVTHLLRAQRREEEGQADEEEAQFGAGEEETDEDEAVTERAQKQHNETEADAEENGPKANGGGRAAEAKNATTAPISGEVKQQQNPQQLQLVHRRQKQLQLVQNVVRVFETQRNVRDGSVLNVPKPSDPNGGAEKKLADKENASQGTTTSQYTYSTTLDHNPLFINDSMDFVMTSSIDLGTPMPTNNSSNATNSTKDASAAVPSAPLRPPHQHCVSMDQLSRLYMLGIALCALFLVGCLFNLLMCCLSRRRTAAGATAAGAGSGALKMPFRTKRGRRQHPAQQKMSAGHSSHTTLTSSLYGGAGNEVKNGNAAVKAQQQVGFWISEESQRNANGAIEYAPMVSSFYEGLPNVSDGNNNVPQQRRLSVHSYASVKQRGNSQLLCKMPMPMNNGSQQHHQHVHQQQLSMSPSSYSPSTTASSSTSGGGGAVAPMLHDNAQQQQQHLPLLNNAQTTLMRSTFHPPAMVGGEQKQQQQSNSSVASSVRSSTTLDGGGPSCSQSTAGDESDGALAGGITPRPFGIVGEFGTTQHHQQQYNNGHGTNMHHSTFRSPTAESNAMLMTNGDHLNESFSIL